MAFRAMREVVRGAVALAVAQAVVCAGRPAFADRTILAGGTVLEGKAVRKGNRVVVRLESGEISIPAESVERIEKSASIVSQFDARYAALPKGGVQARLDLADFCRDHGMRAEERRLLLEVLDIDRDNGAARTRLGYVKSNGAWLTRADYMRAQGMVEREGQWMTPADAAELERQRLAREAAAERREVEQEELQARRMQLAAEQAERDEQAAHLPPSTYDIPYVAVYGGYYPVGYPYGRFGGCSGVGCARGFQRPHPRPAFGAHRGEDTSLSVVKVPYRHHR